MSSIVWDGDNLLQRVGDLIEELGHVKYHENSKTYVLWLKDTRGVFGMKNGYIQGDIFPSMEDAKQYAASSTSASLFHHMWMVGLLDDGNITDKDVAQGVEDAESRKPVTESTFKEEMELITEKLHRAEKETSEKERKSRKREIWFFVVGLAIGLASLFV